MKVMVEKPLVSPSVPTHPICGHEGTLWLIMQNRNLERSPARPQGGQDNKREKTKKNNRHNTRRKDNNKTETRGEERPGQAEGTDRGVSSVSSVRQRG